MTLPALCRVGGPFGRPVWVWVVLCMRAQDVAHMGPGAGGRRSFGRSRSRSGTICPLAKPDSGPKASNFDVDCAELLFLDPRRGCVHIERHAMIQPKLKKPKGSIQSACLRTSIQEPWNQTTQKSGRRRRFRSINVNSNQQPPSSFGPKTISAALPPDAGLRPRPLAFASASSA